MKSEVHTVGILLTMRCNVRCRMCCFSCSPTRNEEVPSSMVQRLIEQVAAYRNAGHPSLKTIAFSGGEVTLRFSELLTYIGMAHARELRTTFTTNGSWGVTQEQADSYVCQCKKAGLTKLSLSFDNFHEEGIPVECIANILRAARQYSIPCDLGSIITHSQSNLSSLFGELGELLIGVRHVVSPCLPVGAAVEGVSHDDYIIDPHILERDTHCTDIDTIAVYPDGSAYPCCSQMGRITALYLGNVFTEGLETVCKHYNANLYVRIINKYGLSWFADVAREEGYIDYSIVPLINLCDLCSRMLSDEVFLQVLKPHLETYKESIYEKYLHSLRDKSAV